MADPTEGFEYPKHGRLINNTLVNTDFWKTQRTSIGFELSSRLESRASEYHKALENRAEAVQKIRDMANELHTLERNYKPYEKGNNVFRISELRTRIGSHLENLKNVDKAMEGYFRSMHRAALKLERFSQNSGLANTITSQLELVKTATARNMMVYVNNPQIPNIQDLINGTRIGTPTNTLPKDLSTEGKLKLPNDRLLSYKASSEVIVRNIDGGLLKGRVAGATSTGELVIKETQPSGAQHLKQGTYRIINTHMVSTIAITNYFDLSSYNAFSNPDKYKQFGGRIYEIKPTEIENLKRIHEFVRRVPAQNTVNQGTINPARPAGIR